MVTFIKEILNGKLHFLCSDKVEENLFTLDNKWVTNERNMRKRKGSNIEKMKLNSTDISDYGDGESVIVKNNVGNFSATFNLNFSSIMLSLLEEEQGNSNKIFTTPPERIEGTSVFSNSPQVVCPEIDKDILDSQDQEELSVLEEL